MNLVSTMSILAGGPGSGCRGGNCGRHGTSKEDIHQPSPARAKTISVDFDNTIAEHKPGNYKLGPPLKNGLALLNELNKQGYNVHIFTARPNLSDVQSWLNAHGVGFAKATNQKIPSMAYIDDRAIRWTGNQPIEEALEQISKMKEVTPLKK